jgi:hypothetical protein
MDLAEPSGAACMFGGLWPCGLDAGAPPLPVSSGPVHPCGWFTPFVDGDVVASELSGALCAFAMSDTNMPVKAAIRSINFIVFRDAMIKADHCLIIDNLRFKRFVPHGNSLRAIPLSILRHCPPSGDSYRKAFLFVASFAPP